MQISLGERKIDLHGPCFVIAEAGVNHNGSVEKALQLVDKAVEAKADAIKFQIFNTESLVVPEAPKAQYQISSPSDGETQFQMLKSLELKLEDHEELFAYCIRKNIQYLATPFDVASAEFLIKLGVRALKISSGDLTNLPFLKHLADKKKPMIVSTGMASMSEVQEAVLTIRNQGNDQLALLHCVSAYPAHPMDVNLRAMDTMSKAYNLLVGFSDHTLGTAVSLAAVARGAKIIEKHFTLSKNLPGPDHKASLEPTELRKFIEDIRNIEAALGDGIKVPAEHELEIAKVVRRSLVAAAHIPKGATIAASMISIKRPGTGLPPNKLGEIIGKKAQTEIAEGTVISLDMLK